MEFHVTIDSRLRFNHKHIPVEMLDELKESLTYKNPEYYKAKNMGFTVKGIPQNIYSYNIESSNQFSIARGAGYKLKEVAKNHNIKIKFIDNRINLPYEFFSSIVPREYQNKPINQLCYLQNGLVQGPCGCGKTVMLLKAIEKIGQRTLIVVHERKLQQQWFDAVKKFFNIDEKDIGLIGGIASKHKIGPITIGLQQSLYKNAEKYANEFGCIVGDEVHRFAANTFQKVIDTFPAKYRIGATATPKRKDGKHFLVFDQFGKIVHEITDQELKDAGKTMDVKIIVVATNFEYNGELRKFKIKRKIDDPQLGAILNEEEREQINHTDLIAKMIMDKDRNRLIYDFIKMEVDKKNFCILLSDRRRFCHNWKDWLAKKDIESKLLVGGDEYSQEGNEAIKRILGPGDLHVVIGTTVADEGLDIDRLNRGFSSTPTATNERRIVQQVGRIKRIAEGKKDAIWYYFLDIKVKGFENHLKLLRKYFTDVEYLSNENEIYEYLYHRNNE